MFARAQTADYFDAANLNHAVAGKWIEAGRFRIEYDFAFHAHLPIISNNRRSWRMEQALPSPVCTTASARARFSLSGICLARMAASFSSLMFARASARWR